jgi:hypothetical protein
MRRSTDDVDRLAAAQASLVTRSQLLQLGFDNDAVRNQVTARRWAVRSATVVSTTTGVLSRDQLVWLAVLHAGRHALVGGLTALQSHGLRNWDRDHVTVTVPDHVHLERIPPQVRVVRTRRSMASWRVTRGNLPVMRIEPAALLFAASERSQRTALGLLAAVVQQRLTTAENLLDQMADMRPLRRAKTFRTALRDISGGAQSLAELDVGRICRQFGLPKPRRQGSRRDSRGRQRYTDCEWVLPDGTVLVLEVDGAFHMEVEHWEDDLARQRRLTTPGRMVVRCTARELRDDPHAVVRDLMALGLSQSCA